MKEKQIKVSIRSVLGRWFFLQQGVSKVLLIASNLITFYEFYFQINKDKLKKNFNV